MSLVTTPSFYAPGPELSDLRVSQMLQNESQYDYLTFTTLQSCMTYPDTEGGRADHSKSDPWTFAATLWEVSCSASDMN